MRILIDLQAAQTDSRSRGIGRYATGLAKAIIRNRGEHDVCILLNSLFQDSIESVREQFSAVLPADRIVAFSVPEAVEALAADNAWRIAAAELIREWMIDALAPDVLLIPSLFEGPIEPAIVSIGRLTDTKTAVVLHDLIPFLDPETYLDKGLGRDWYYSKIEYLRRADLLLAISTSARGEAIDALGFDRERAVTVYSGADERFTNAKVSSEAGQALLRRLGIQRKFVMHASLIEPRKNFEGLIRAFGLLPRPMRAAHQLVIVGDDGHQTEKHLKQVPLRRLANDIGLAPDDLVFTGHVADDELVALYSLCTLFVFPSFHEGFGLPALEAMCCGAAVIGSNTTSIPEVVGREDALFDPHSDRSIAQVMERALIDSRFLESLRAHARTHSQRFSWDRSAQLALRAMQKIAVAPAPARAMPDISVLLEKIAAIRVGTSPGRNDLAAVASCIAGNEKALSQWRLVQNGNATATDATQRRPEPTDSSNSGAYDEIFTRKLYHIFHDREPDREGLAANLRDLRTGTLPHELVERFVQSEEFALRLPLRLAQRTRSLERAQAGPEDTQRTGVGSIVDQGVEVIRHQVWLPDERPRILLLKLDHIGDFAMTVDSFQLLRDTWPKADITLVCGPWNRSLAEQLGLFDMVLCCDFYPVTTTTYDKDAVTKQGIAAYCALPLGTYDLALDLRIYDDNRVLLSHTDTKYRAGYAAAAVALDLALPVGSESEMTAHIGGRTLALAAAVAWTFGVPAGGGRTRILNGREPVRLFNDGIVVGISPGTRNALRSWGREQFADLARILLRNGDYRFALIGGNDDRPDTEFIGSFLPRTDFVDLAGTLPIGDVPPIFAGLDVFIGGETGTTHMSALLGTPTVCIYSGQTNVDSWRPAGPHVVTLRNDVPCSPCFLSTIDQCRWNKRCMDIPPARVAAEAIALVERVGSRRRNNEDAAT